MTLYVIEISKPAEICENFNQSFVNVGGNMANNLLPSQARYGSYFGEVPKL